MDTEPASSHQFSPRAAPLAGWINLSQPSLCPCGHESLDSGGGRHVIGALCREKVERHVRRRFGRHRYGGRYATEVPDLIQDCYQRLLAPGGLNRFQPAPGREAGDAFAGWLWKVVHNYCNNKVHGLLAQPAVGGDKLDSVPESRDAITPEQAFAQLRIRELGERAVAEAKEDWEAKGAIWIERFNVILQLVYEKEADTARACERLGITDLHLRQLRFKLTARIRLEWRKQILDGLELEPGIEPQVIELMIDREIEALFQEAFPGSSPLSCLGCQPEPNDGKAKDEDANDEDANDEEPEWKP